MEFEWIIFPVFIHIEVANEEPDAVGVCRPWSCSGTESLSELLEGPFWLIMQVNDSTMAIVEPNPNEMVTSREETFVFSNSSRAENVIVRQDDRSPSIHVTRAQSTKIHPNSTVQDNVNVGKVLNPAVGLLRQRLSDFSAILWRYLNFSRGLWLDAVERNYPRVFRVQTRSSFARRWRHVEATASYRNAAGFQGVSFPPPEQSMDARQAGDSIGAMQGAISIKNSRLSQGVIGHSTRATAEAVKSRVTAPWGLGARSKREHQTEGKSPPPEGRGTARSPQRKHNRP